MEKSEIVSILNEMAAILEIRGENPFRVRAFANGARSLEGWEGDLAALAAKGELRNIRGIGEGLARVIQDLLATGRSSDHEELRGSIPETLLDLLRIPGVGPKKARALHLELGISTLDELKRACQAHKVRELRGFGEKSETDILAGIERAVEYSRRHRFDAAEAIGRKFLAAIAGVPGVVQASLAGSLRRRLETIGDIDLLVACEDPESVRRAFLSVPGIRAREAEGETKLRVVASEGIAVDLRVVEPEAFGAALCYFTGSKLHNTRLRGLARERGLKLNEYGLWKNDRRLAGASEEEIFAALGLAYVPPEMREDQGEIEAALASPSLPELVAESDLRGTLHCHTTASDGANTLAEMAEAARRRGWKYLGIADHSRSAAYAGGLSIEKLRAQRREIERLNRKLDGFTLLHGVESDILADGSLDYPDDVLAELDYVVVSVHSGFSQSRAAQTARIEKALRHPATSIWGHPTGRLLLQREGYALDMEHLLLVAAEEGVIVELNSHPSRLDIDWRWGTKVRELAIDVGIHPDAHTTEGLADVAYGVGIARKAGLRPERISNTLTLGALRKRLARAHR